MKSAKAAPARRGDEIAAGVQPDSIVAEGLALLDEEGLGGCTLAAITARLGTDVTDTARHFASREALLGAMAQAMISDAPAVAPAADWRDALAKRALAGRQVMLSRRDGSLLFAQMPMIFPNGSDPQDCVPAMCAAGFTEANAQSAVMLVDRLTIGSALAEQTAPGAIDGQAAFEAQLDIVLTGIAASQSNGPVSRRDERQSRFQSKLWVFLRDARESANISFARTAHVNELDRRILLLLLVQGPMTLAVISMACGVDKAQISRAIKRMSEIALLARGGIRSPIRLSTTGRQLAERLQRQAELRNRELTFGISDDQIVALFGVLDTLLGRAIALFDQERRLSAAHNQREQVDFQDLVDEGLPDENGVAVDRSRVLPPFVTLCSYMLRGGALSHKRRTSLSNFETWVLSEVCKNPPISWPQLVVALYRDQSQAGRTVNHLIDIGLVERTGKPGRRHGFFAPTPEGERISEIVEETAVRRSEFLFQGIPADQLHIFMTAFETLARNAEVQVARERAIQEMDRIER